MSPIHLDFAAVAPIAAATAMAAVPLYAVLRGRVAGAPLPLSMGRHALFFAGVFAASLLGFRFLTALWTLLAYSLALFVFAFPLGRRRVVRLVAGRAWARANDGAIGPLAKRQFIPLVAIAVAFFLAGLISRLWAIGLRSVQP